MTQIADALYAAIEDSALALQAAVQLEDSDQYSEEYWSEKWIPYNPMGYKTGEQIWMALWLYSIAVEETDISVLIEDGGWIEVTLTEGEEEASDE